MLNNLKNRKSKQEGFTIIEVLIVLAIAGLILLIVFLAVPSLQRSSRNTQRKNDAAAIGGAIANFISNNSGTVPKKLDAVTASSLKVCNGGGGSPAGTTACTGNTELAKLGYYDNTKIYISAAAATPVAATVGAPGSEAATKVSTNSVAIIYGQDCTPAASSRTAAIYYATESGSGNGSLQCVEQ